VFAQLINRINRTDPRQPDDQGAGVDVAVANVAVANVTRSGVGIEGADALFAHVADDVAPEHRALIEMAIDWVDAPLAFFGQDLSLQFANTAYAALVGHDRDALIGRSIDDVAFETSRGGARGYATRALLGESVDIDLAHRQGGALDGVSRQQYRPQRQPDGRVIGVVCLLQRLGRRQTDKATDPDDGLDDDRIDLLAADDQGGRAAGSAPMRAAFRLAQETVAERERKQRELIGTLPLPLLFVDTDGRCKWANTAFCKACGVPEPLVNGMAVAAFAAPLGHATLQGLARAAEGKSFSIEERLALGAGEARWHRIDCLPGFDRDHVHNGVYVLLSDIDEVHRSTQRLQESEAHFRGFTENVPESIVFIDREGRFRYVNESFIRRSGRTREALIGRSVEDVFGAAVLESARESLARAFDGEAFTCEGHALVGDREEWRELRLLPVRGAEGEVLGIYLVSRSIEDEKRTQRALREHDERMHILTDNLPAQIAYVDAELKYRYCNQRFLSDHGLASIDEVAGKTPVEIPGADLATYVADYAPTVMRGERVTYERPATGHPGDHRWLSVTLAPDFAEDGTVRGLYSIAHDITDAKLATSARERQQAWIEAFIENFPQPLSYLDPNGVHQYANRAYEAFVGRDKAQIIGHAGSEVFGRDVADIFKPSFLRGVAGERLHAEHRVPRDGQPDRHLSADWMPDLDVNGEVKGVYFVIQDVSEARQARSAYEESLREMQRAMDSVALPISFVDLEERLRFVNHATTVWHRRSADELIGMPLSELMPADDYRFAEPYIRAALGGESVQYEREMRYHDGVRRWVLIRYVATRDEHDAVTGFYTTATDIQARKKHELALQQANGLLTAHFENTPLASFTLDRKRRITRWSSQAETLFGWRRDEVFERSFNELGLIAPELLADFLPTDDDPDTTIGNTRLHIVETHRRDGSRVTCEWHVAALRDAAGDITSSLALIQDVSQRVEAERRLTEIAHRDTLTRLLNRNALEPTLRSFIERARHNLERARQSPEHHGPTGVAVLFLDLDHFKNINDTLGHRVGDLMLIEVAAILRNSVRAEDEVARIGGDEFMVVIGHSQPKAIAHETAQRILTALAMPIRVDNQRLSVSSSIGIAIYPDHGRAPDALIRSADLAMYRAKENGKNRFEFFSAMLAQRSERRSAVKSALKIAMQKEVLRLYFQPRVRVVDNLIVGAETLLRWTDPRLGVVSPKEFIVIAEESGLIHELGLYVFRKACRQLREWQDRGIKPGILSVNFSAHQLLVATFIDEVDTVIHESGVDPRCIEVEITETSMLFDLGVTRNVIADLKQRGMHIAIDDFGTGFSSLSHLQQLDVDTLKIDQSFIRDMLHDSGDAAITTSVISMARGLGLSTTAEGVENERQLDALREAGCDYYQGFLFSPAIVVEDIETLLNDQGGAVDETGLDNHR
jgi:diguanylate cyclase (GGDEF)-like protein/PAS domain S-box-containing protein